MATTVFINHYTVLGFSPGSIVSKEEIKKAYRLKALKFHPDKRLGDPDAVSAFQQLQASYEILNDDNAKKAFDYNLQQMHHRETMKRKKMSSDLVEEEAERKLADLYDDKERKRKKIEKYERGTMSQEEKERARFFQTNYTLYDKEKMLWVHWGKGYARQQFGFDSNEKTFREMFETYAFGDVEDVVIIDKSFLTVQAIVFMATKEAADIAVDENVRGKHSRLIIMHFE